MSDTSTDVAAEIASGDRRRALVAMRDDLARKLKGIDARYAAPLFKELRNIVAELDKLPGGEELSPLDRIAGSVPADELAPRRKGRKPRASA